MERSLHSLRSVEMTRIRFLDYARNDKGGCTLDMTNYFFLFLAMAATDFGFAGAFTGAAT